jgi:hydrogenase maturation factor
MTCEDGRCVTCADEAVPMRVLAPPVDGLALCAGAEGAETEVMTDLVGAVAPGDDVLVHAGVALARVA